MISVPLRPMIGFCALFALSTLTARRAAAATINFFDIGSAPYVTVTGTDASRVTYTGTGCVAEVCTVTIAPPPFADPSQAISGLGAVSIFDPSDNTLLSDSYTMNALSSGGFVGGATLVFTSGLNQHVTPSFGLGNITETGLLQSLDTVTWSLRPTNPNVPPRAFFSDQVNFVSSELPEPSSMILMVGGLLGLGMRVLRSHGKARLTRPRE